jgi:hypothetical protein
MRVDDVGGHRPRTERRGRPGHDVALQLGRAQPA